ncbi:MAG: hypothetical protein FWE95_10125 [Planctomycetaceae bacterium]|nr:hypothetical protein [Planctomycetaceae bacterium]
MSRKVLTTLATLAVMLAFATSTMAGTLYSKANEWYYDAEAAGTLTVKDNKKDFTHDVAVGVNFLGLQKNYTGQLKFVDFVAAVVECNHYFNQWKAVEIQKRTCTEEGVWYWPCDYCDKVHEHSLPGYHSMNDHGHDWSCWEWVEIAATCTTEGFEGYICKFCDEEDGEAIPPLGHNFEVDESVPPTCTAWGYTTYTCSQCEKSYRANWKKPLGHEYKAKVTVPTCTEEGFTTYTCSRCDDEYIDDEVKALGHSFNYDEPEWENDEYRAYCFRCDENVVAQSLVATFTRVQGVSTWTVSFDFGSKDDEGFQSVSASGVTEGTGTFVFYEIVSGCTVEMSVGGNGTRLSYRFVAPRP